MIENTLKIEVSDKVKVIDVFGAPKKWVTKVIKKAISVYVELFSIPKVVTLTWVPILARCPSDNVSIFKQLMTVAFYG